MDKPSGVVALERSSGSSRRNDVGAVDGSIVEKWFVRERKWVSKMLGNNRGRKINVSFLVLFEAAPLEVQLWV